MITINLAPRRAQAPAQSVSMLSVALATGVLVVGVGWFGLVEAIRDRQGLDRELSERVTALDTRNASVMAQRRNLADDRQRLSQSMEDRRQSVAVLALLDGLRRIAQPGLSLQLLHHDGSGLRIGGRARSHSQIGAWFSALDAAGVVTQASLVDVHRDNVPSGWLLFEVRARLPDASGGVHSVPEAK